jgi:hypothetical protein
MRTFAKVALAAGLVALAAAPAWAQQGKGQGRGGFGGGGGAMLLNNKSVHEELKVTEDQASKLQTLATEMREKAQADRQGLKDLSQDEQRQKRRELNETHHAALMKGLGEILKPEQVKRFEQIHLQTAGLAALATPSVEKKLGLTDDQKAKLRTIQEDSVTGMRQIFQDAGQDREAATKKLTELRKENNEKALAVLTDSQKAMWKEMTGAPFQVKFEGGFGGGGGARRKRAE